MLRQTGVRLFNRYREQQCTRHTLIEAIDRLEGAYSENTPTPTTRLCSFRRLVQAGPSRSPARFPRDCRGCIPYTVSRVIKSAAEATGLANTYRPKPLWPPVRVGST